MDQVMAELDGPPLAEEEHEPVPWEDPAIARLYGFWRTLNLVLFQPEDFFQNLAGEKTAPGPAEPFAFALIAGSVGTVCSIFWFILLGAAAHRAGGGLSGLPEAIAAGTLIVLAPLRILISLAIGGFCLWAAVALLRHEPASGPAWRVWCYAYGGMIFGVIPIFGLLVAAVYVQFLLYLGAYSLLSQSPLKALAALVVSRFLGLVIVLLLIGALLTFLGLLGFLLFLGGG
jgi:hypothetical protein